MILLLKDFFILNIDFILTPLGKEWLPHLLQVFIQLSIKD